MTRSEKRKCVEVAFGAGRAEHSGVLSIQDRISVRRHAAYRYHAESSSAAVVPQVKGQGAQSIVRRRSVKIRMRPPRHDNCSGVLIFR